MKSKLENACITTLTGIHHIHYVISLHLPVIIIILMKKVVKGHGNVIKFHPTPKRLINILLLMRLLQDCEDLLCIIPFIM